VHADVQSGKTIWHYGQTIHDRPTSQLECLRRLEDLTALSLNSEVGLVGVTWTDENERDAAFQWRENIVAGDRLALTPFGGLIVFLS
jgi:hypothetical protein